MINNVFKDDILRVDDKLKLAVIGLGYVGLPLTVEFSKKYQTIGFDINENRIKELSSGFDSTLEVDSEELEAAGYLKFSSSAFDLSNCNVFIITVPTPIDKYNRPDLSPLISASKTVGSAISKGAIVIYESTVYPGATEEECVPVLEEFSGLVFNKDFFVGYSPERINPGDKENRFINIIKVTSGSTPEAADFVDKLYQTVVVAGTHKASSIKVAEAAKVIENTQRDINIALINELAIIFDHMEIDTQDVLDAAGTKWNFLKFKPGLVGGHCIGVDPYYLTHKAQSLGYHPEIILAGRRINDGMGEYVAEQVMRLMTRKRIHVVDSRILVMGFTFKENCTDVRNTKVNDMVSLFRAHNALVDVYDPWVKTEDIMHEYGISTAATIEEEFYDAIVIAVGHKQFLDMGVDKIRSFGKKEAILFDVKNIFKKSEVDGRL
jgi:UDP-N-acetyl-D-galactosamine dehydrogenase